MNIDKNKFKEYINGKYPDTIRIVDIKNISIREVIYNKDQVEFGSIYYDRVQRDGFIKLDMIVPICSYWKLVSDPKTITSSNSYMLGTWKLYGHRNSRQYLLNSYLDWLIDTRDKKLDDLGI